MWDNLWYHIAEFSQGFFPEIGAYLLKLIVIIILVIVSLEILKTLKVLDFLNRVLYVLTKPLGISERASMPLLIGLLAGISYGVGAIIASYNSGDMDKRDAIIVGTFLCICHALPEDTLLFISAGAIGWVVALVRLVAAIIVTIIVKMIYDKKENKNTIGVEENEGN